MDSPRQRAGQNLVDQDVPVFDRVEATIGQCLEGQGLRLATVA